MAIQFMLMTLFQIVSGMADDPQGFRSDVHKELTDLVATYISTNAGAYRAENSSQRRRDP